MEYLYYMLSVLLIGLLSLMMIRYWSTNDHGKAKLRFILRRSQSSVASPGAPRNPVKPHPAGKPLEAERSTRKILQRELLQVRTPWGWPGHDELNGGNVEQPNFYAVIQSFTSRLIRQKELANSPSRNSRINGSVRALLEDRYCPVNRQSMESIEYRKVKAPLLRDPSEPHDQMDNFGTDKAERIGQKLQRLKIAKANLGIVAYENHRPSIDLKDIRQPWGW